MASWLTTRNSNLAAFNAFSINYSTLTGSTSNNIITAGRVNYSTITGSSVAATSVATNSLLLASTLTGSSIMLSGNVLNSGTSNLTVATQSTGLLILNSQGGALALQSGGVTYASLTSSSLAITGPLVPTTITDDLVFGNVLSGYTTIVSKNIGSSLPTVGYGNLSCSIGWNYSELGGDITFINNYGSSSNGGFTFWDRTGTSTTRQLMRVTSTGLTLGTVVLKGSQYHLFCGYNVYGTVTDYNVLMGATVGRSGSTGVYNTLYGHGIGYGLTSGSYNTMLGNNLGYSMTSGVNNVLVGYQNGTNITTGYNNIIVGNSSGINMTTCDGNTLVGYQAGRSITTGNWNVAIGERALSIIGSTGTGNYNVAVGHYTFPQLTTGQYNTGLGAFAGTTITTGTYNTYIGYNSVASGGNVNDEIVIGASATGAGSNTITLGNSSNTKTIFNGTINCGNFNVSSGITVVYNLNPGGRDTFTTTLQVPGSGFYLLSAFSTLYNGATWGSSAVWCNAVISSYLSGYATTYPPATGTVLYSANIELNIDANGYIVISFPAGDGNDTFRINYLRLS